EGYQGGLWLDIITAGASASAPDRGIQFNSGGAFTASSNFQYMADGDLLLSGTFTGTASVPVTGAGTRMFFDTQKAAFRAGYVSGTQWDNASIGIYSTAMGSSTTASVNYSIAMGLGTTASGSFGVALGNQTISSGNEGSFAAGFFTEATGSASFAIGREAKAAGGNSVAFGLFDATGTKPEVSGQSSYGIFMGDQSGLVMSATNTMGLFGGKMVIDPAVPATQLTARGVIDAGAATDAIVFPSGTTAQRPGAPVNGMIRYNSSNDKFEGYQGGLWLDIITAGASASAPDRGIQFNSGGAFTASSSLIYSSQGSFMVSGTHSGVGAPPATGSGTRMFFDPTKSAFRAGRVTGTQWDNANIGVYSIATGLNTKANGLNSTAMGSSSTASGDTSVAIGNVATASGDFSVAIGDNPTSSGVSSVALGLGTTASGNSSTAMGESTIANGTASTAMGFGSNAGGNYSTAMGTNTSAGGIASTAAGYQANADGDYSAVFGNQLNISATGDGSAGFGLTTTSPATDPIISGTQSFGVFMGNHSAVNFAAANTVGFFGGNMVIDPAVPAMQLTARGVLDVGAATDAIVFPSGTTAQRPGAPVNGMIRYNSSNDKFEGYQGGVWTDIITAGASAAAPDRGIQFNSGSAFTASSNLRYMADGDLLLSGTFTGTASVPATGAGTRMFFDTQKAAFRAGYVSGTQWDNASIGDYSVAMGRNTTASGFVSTAMGQLTTANNANSTAMGFGTTASGVNSTAMGQNTTASGDNSTATGSSTAASGSWSTAMGNTTTASGNSSTAMGYATTASGGASTAMGSGTTASGSYSTAMGFKVTAGNGTAGSGLGDGSMALGLIDDAVAITTASQVTGIQSMGIFMGDQDGLVMSANSTMGLFGGKMVIDPAVPATQLTARGVIDAGAATDAIVLPSGTTAQRPGAPVNGMLRYNSSSSKFEAYQAGAWSDIITNGAGGIALNDLVDASTDYAVKGSLYIGEGAIAAGSAGTSNVGVGSYAFTNNTGNQNTVLGSNAFRGTGTGSDNTAIGHNALTSTTNGIGNVGVGSLVMLDNATGNQNTALGMEALRANMGGSNSTAIGYWAMRYANNASGVFTTYNTAVGAQALRGSVTAASNTGTSNTAIGYGALLVVSSGSSNIAIGDRAADGLTTGSNNITIGSNVDAVSATGSNQLNIGDTIYGDLSTDGVRIGGAGAVSAFSDLELAGTLALKVSAGTTAQRPGTPVNGMIRYNTDNGKFEGYQAGAWQDILTGSAAASAPDRGIQFNSGGNFAAVDTFLYSSAGDFIVGSTQKGDTGNAAHDSRMFFDKAKSAFRAGTVTGAEWDNASVGSYSFAVGGPNINQVTASGTYSIAMGGGAVASNTGSIAMGTSAISNSSDSIAIGSTTVAGNVGAVAIGYNTTASGNTSTALGYLTTASGSQAFAAGRQTTASGIRSVALGSSTIAAGDFSTAFGNEVNVSATGDGSAGFGLTTTSPATDPIVSGAQSMGIFMGNHSAVNFAAANTMGLFGGKMVIDPAVPATQLTARGVLDLGAATDAIVFPTGTTAQRPGTPVNGMIRYNSSNDKFEGYQAGVWTDIITAGGTPAGANTQVQFNSGGVFGAAAYFTWDNAQGLLGIGSGSAGNADRLDMNGNHIRGVDDLKFNGGPNEISFLSMPNEVNWRLSVTDGTNADAEVFTVMDGGFVGINNNNPNAALDVIGNIEFTGTLHDVSDMRLKTDIHPLRDRGSMLERLDQIGTYSFRMKDDKGGQIEFGVMAQEINKVFPELVAVDESTAEKYMSVNYLGLIAPLLEASKELKAENDDLKTRLASVEDDIKGLKVQTGYGINKAGAEMWMLLLMAVLFGASSATFVIGAVVRRKSR
ncbi:MAG: tail fiber domain-containing protein, partial [Micavibrio aeruginosavorus]|nr:tail fiber domain-containing protein [Micavibrio aeruginosavorus]